MHVLLTERRPELDNVGIPDDVPDPDKTSGQMPSIPSAAFQGQCNRLSYPLYRPYGYWYGVVSRIRRGVLLSRPINDTTPGPR